MAWFYATSRDTGRWDGFCASREEAIEEATDAYSGEPFYVAEGTEQDSAGFFPDADDAIETASQRAYDNCGECAEEWPDCTKEAKAELDASLAAVFKAWVEKYATPRCFEVVDGDPEHIDPKAESEGRDG